MTLILDSSRLTKSAKSLQLFLGWCFLVELYWLNDTQMVFTSLFISICQFQVSIIFVYFFSILWMPNFIFIHNTRVDPDRPQLFIKKNWENSLKKAGYFLLAFLIFFYGDCIFNFWFSYRYKIRKEKLLKVRCLSKVNDFILSD